MRVSRRPLRLDLFEERSLPSVSFPHGNPDHAPPAHAAAYEHSAVWGREAQNVVVWDRTFLLGDGSVLRVQIRLTEPFVRFIGGDGRDDSRSDRGGSTSSQSGSSDGDFLRPGGATRAIVQSRTNFVEQRGPVPATMVTPPESEADEQTNGAAAAATAAEQAPPGAGVSTLSAAAQILSGQMVALSTAGHVLIGESTDVADAPPATIPPAAEPEEVPALPDAPPEDPAPDFVVDSPLPFVLPAIGALPIDLATVGACASNFLGRVADLDVTLPDGSPAFEDYVWTATAVLLAGGAVYSATTDRNGRTTRRAPGTGSVLAAWEGTNVGRPD